MKLTFCSKTNFVYPNKAFVRKALKLKNPYIFIFKKEDNFYLRFVEREFTQQTQCGYVHQYGDRWLFENLSPENQMLFYQMGLPYNIDNELTLTPTDDETEYKLCANRPNA